VRDNESERIEVREFTFNGIIFDFIDVKINHVNYDRENRCRSNFTAAEVAQIVRQNLDDQEDEPEGINEQVEYYRKHIYLGEKKYRIVLSICTNMKMIELITLFRISQRGTNEET
jgi:hypothetical protein